MMIGASDADDTSDGGSGDGTDDGGGDDGNSIIRGKWCLDGCRTLQEVIDKLRRDAAAYEELRDAGWELTQQVDDDYGFMRLRTV